MRTITVGIIVIYLIIAPVILQSCICGGMSGDDAYYDIKNMLLSVLHPGSSATVPPSKLSDLNFSISFDVNRAALETMHGSALYACDVAPQISNQQVSAILITSNHDLATTSGTTAAGENLNFLFVVDATGHINAPLSDLINNPLLDPFLNFSSDIVLTSAQSHKFTFKITLDDGRVFTMDTGELALLQG